MTFVFRPILTIVTVVGLCVLVGLGTWQLRRLEWKRDLVATINARLDASPIPFDEALNRHAPEAGQDATYTPVRLEGAFRHDLEAHVFGAIEGEAGFFVFTPLELTSADPAEPRVSVRYVYVNRGFVPQRLKSPADRRETAPDGVFVVEGLFRAAEPEGGLVDVFRPPNDLQRNVWHERRPSSFAAVTGIAAAPDYVDAFASETDSQWPKGGTTRVEFSNRHLEYALTWFGLGATLVGVYAAFSIRR